MELENCVFRGITLGCRTFIAEWFLRKRGREGRIGEDSGRRKCLQLLHKLGHWGPWWDRQAIYNSDWKELKGTQIRQAQKGSELFDFLRNHPEMSDSSRTGFHWASTSDLEDRIEKYNPTALPLLDIPSGTFNV